MKMGNYMASEVTGVTAHGFYRIKLRLRKA